MMPKVTFLPSERTVDCQGKELVFRAAQRSGLLIPTACNGHGTCGLCRVKVVSGEEFLSPITKAEKHHLGNTYFVTKLRLSCQFTVSGEVTLELPLGPERPRSVPF